MKDKRTLLAVILLAAAGVAVFFLFMMMNKKKNSEQPADQGFRKAAPAAYKTDNLMNIASSVTDLGKNIRLDIGADASRQLFGTTSGVVFVPKSSTGIRFNAAPELVAKLKAKYGAGELFQKGKNLTDGFEWVTSSGTTQLSFKDFVTLSKS